MTLGRLVDKKTPSYNPEDKVYVKGKYHKKGNIVSALKLQESLKKEFIDCDEYPPLTKWYKENIDQSQNTNKEEGKAT